MVGGQLSPRIDLMQLSLQNLSKDKKKSRNFKFVLTKTKKISIFNMFGPLAQLVEHKTFNLGVPGSSPGWATKDKICCGILESEINMLISFFYYYNYCIQKLGQKLGQNFV